MTNRVLPTKRYALIASVVVIVLLLAGALMDFTKKQSVTEEGWFVINVPEVSLSYAYPPETTFEDHSKSRGSTFRNYLVHSAFSDDYNVETCEKSGEDCDGFVVSVIVFNVGNETQYLNQKWIEGDRIAYSWEYKDAEKQISGLPTRTSTVSPTPDGGDARRVVVSTEKFVYVFQFTSLDYPAENDSYEKHHPLFEQFLKTVEIN